MTKANLVTNRNPRSNRPAPPRAFLILRPLLAVLIAPTLLAQDVVVPAPSFPSGQEPAAPTRSTPSTSFSPAAPESGGSGQSPAGTGQSGSVIVGAPSLPSFLAPLENPFQWGPIVLHPRVAYTFTYGNGIQSSPGDRQKSIIQTVAPSLGLDLGPHWRLNYTPTLTFYSDRHFKNTLNHAVSLSWGTVYEDWSVGLSQNCSLTSQPEIQTARQTDRQSYNTGLNATYRINTPTSLEFGFNQSINDVSGYTNSVGSTRTWSTMDWLNYQWGPRLGTAGGLGFGYTSAEIGGDTTYEDLQGRITWQALQKVSLSLSGGADIRQFLDTSAATSVNPIFAVSLAYQPFKVTTLTLSASRTVNQSTYYVDQTTEATGFTAALRQRFFGRYYLTLSGGYTSTSYQTTVPGFYVFRGYSFNRQDSYTFFRAGVSTAFLERGTASVFYSTSDNSSNTGSYGYTSDQVGFSLSYGY